MGAWGAGLYSGDFGTDLRATIGAVLRLPFDADRLVDIVCDVEPASTSPASEEHTTFWLILADQFCKRGIVSERVREHALEIIDRGEDLAMMRSLSMNASDLRKRQKVLDDLRARLVAPGVSKPRTVLREPQPLLMDVGDVIVYPTCHGRCINPYLTPGKQLEVLGQPWTQNDWGAAIVIDCGCAFGFLAWYRPITLVRALAGKPDIET